MAKNSIEAYGAEGKTNLLFFDPDTLHLVEDKASPLYDERVHLPLDEKMVLSIKHSGFKQPISVRKNPETDLVEVVVGRQRVKNGREANRRLREEGQEPRLVPAFVQRGTDAELATTIVIENEIRQADTPLGRARKMQRLLGMNQPEEIVAVAFGVSVPTVRSSMALLECTAAVRNAVESGSINVSHALKLSKLSPDEQRQKVAELVQAGEGRKGVEKARSQRAVVDKGPRMRSRTEVQAARKSAAGEMAAVLDWVLGLRDLPEAAS